MRPAAISRRSFFGRHHHPISGFPESQRREHLCGITPSSRGHSWTFRMVDTLRWALRRAQGL